MKLETSKTYQTIKEQQTKFVDVWQ